MKRFEIIGGAWKGHFCREYEGARVEQGMRKVVIRAPDAYGRKLTHYRYVPLEFLREIDAVDTRSAQDKRIDDIDRSRDRA